MARFVVMLELIILFGFTAFVCHVETNSNGVLLSKTGPITLPHSDSLVFEIHDYTKCVGVFILCYFAPKHSQGERNCSPGFCSLVLDAARSDVTETPMPAENTAIFSFKSLIKECPPNVATIPQEYKVLELFSGCSIYAKNAAESTTETELSTTVTTNQSGHVTAAQIVIYVLCGVVLIAIISVTGYLFYYCCYVKPRRVEAARNRRQSQVASTNVEGVRLLAVSTTPSATATATATATSTNPDTRKVEQQLPQPVVTRSQLNDPVKIASVPAPLKSKTEDVPVPSKTLTKTEASKIVALINESQFKAKMSLRAQRTQDSPTGSEGTPPKNYDVARSMKKTSMFLAKHYVPNSQSNVPYRKKKKLDSTEQLLPIGESILASFERQKHLSKTVQMVVAGRWNLEVEHEMHPLEKHVLRDVIEIAFPALEKLIRHLDNLLLDHGALYDLNDSSESTWEYVNRSEVPASAAIRLLMKSYPSIVDGLEAQMRDPIIAELSVSAMYSLLFSDKFDKKFKREIIIELRARACIILRDVPANNLFSSPYPLSYLALRFKANRGDFVIGIVPKKGVAWNDATTTQDV